MTHALENVVTDYEMLRLGHVLLEPSRDHDQLAMLLQLQRDRPLHWHKGFWVLTRYADVNAALRDKRLVNRISEPDRKGLPFVRAVMNIIKRECKPSKKYMIKPTFKLKNNRLMSKAGIPACFLLHLHHHHHL